MSRKCMWRKTVRGLGLGISYSLKTDSRRFRIETRPILLCWSKKSKILLFSGSKEIQNLKGLILLY